MEGRWSLGQPVPTTAVALAMTFLAVAVTVFRRWSRKSQFRMPPGPMGFPVLGCLPLLGARPHESLAKLAKKYGSLMSITLGSVKVVVATSPEVTAEFLKTNDKIWSSRYTTTAGKILSYDGSDIVFSEMGPKWRYARKIFMMELFTQKRLADFQPSRKQEILRGVNDAITRSDGGAETVQLDIILAKVATNIVIRMLMNERSLSEKAAQIKKSDVFRETIKSTFKLLEGFYLGDYVPWLDRIDPQGMKKQMHAVAKNVDALAQTILDDHKMKLEITRKDLQGNPNKAPSGEVEDIVDALLSRPRDGDGQYMSEKEMKAIITNIIFAGTDTNSGTVEAALRELLRNPHGYKIPAKTTLFVNTWAIQRDPNVYERPLDFYPERLLGNKKDVHGQDFDLLPFGSGRRICPGKGLALLVVPYTLAIFIQTCNLRLPGDMKPEDYSAEVSSAEGHHLEALVTPRLSKDLFLNTAI
ncbi:hypothetical protein R1sor_005401 [Riccia sorocarpa]|uniref:Cytochrome P450 n=1 Tax=Riccia sorocarpa TaxID=122646 RepID=A0ABD3HN87_9MARC